MQPLIFVTIPGLRAVDLEHLPHLQNRTANGECRDLTPGFPCVGSTVQANMTTGHLPDAHGVIGNGFYFTYETFPDRPIRNKRYRGDLPMDESFAIENWPPKLADKTVEMWLSPAECVARPQFWDKIRRKDDTFTTAIWFAQHLEGGTADYLCSPHPLFWGNRNQSRFYSRPFDFYLELKEKIGEFPLHKFWGPQADRDASDWIIASAFACVKTFHPQLIWICLPHLDVACQKFGPDSPEYDTALAELDDMFRILFDGMNRVCREEPLWLIAGEFAATRVETVFHPNRLLREMNLLSISRRDDGEYVNIPISRAFAVCDHQFSHIYFNVADEGLIRKVADRFRQIPELEQVLALEERKKYHLEHERSGEIVLISRPDSWQAYHWWLDAKDAPPFAHTVNRYNKPGHDPGELFEDILNTAQVRGSYGAPALSDLQKTLLLTSSTMLVLPKQKGKKKTPLTDTVVSKIIIDYFFGKEKNDKSRSD